MLLIINYKNYKKFKFKFIKLKLKLNLNWKFEMKKGLDDDFNLLLFNFVSQIKLVVIILSPPYTPENFQLIQILNPLRFGLK